MNKTNHKPTIIPQIFSQKVIGTPEKVCLRASVRYNYVAVMVLVIHVYSV